MRAYRALVRGLCILLGHPQVQGPCGVLACTVGSPRTGGAGVRRTLVLTTVHSPAPLQTGWTHWLRTDSYPGAASLVPTGTYRPLSPSVLTIALQGGITFLEKEPP